MGKEAYKGDEYQTKGTHRSCLPGSIPGLRAMAANKYC
jgi:hypothetical protein